MEVLPNRRGKRRSLKNWLDSVARIPVNVEVREDLHAMQAVVRNGEYSYSAPRTAEGHSDRCTALALAKRATSGSTSSAEFEGGIRDDDRRYDDYDFLTGGRVYAG